MITTLFWYMQDRMEEVLVPTAHAPLIALALRNAPRLPPAGISDFEKMPAG